MSDHFDLHQVMASAILMLAIALVALSQMAVGASALLYSYALLAGLGFSGAFYLHPDFDRGPLQWTIVWTHGGDDRLDRHTVWRT